MCWCSTTQEFSSVSKKNKPRLEDIDWQDIFVEGTRSRNEAVRERCKKHRSAHTKVYKPTKEEKLRLLALIATWASIDHEDFGTYPINDGIAIEGGLEWWLDELFGSGKVYGL